MRGRPVLCYAFVLHVQAGKTALDLARDKNEVEIIALLMKRDEQPVPPPWESYHSEFKSSLPQHRGSVLRYSYADPDNNRTYYYHPVTLETTYKRPTGSS